MRRVIRIPGAASRRRWCRHRHLVSRLMGIVLFPDLTIKDRPTQGLSLSLVIIYK